MNRLRLAPVDLADATHARDLLQLLDHYARDPMGGGSGLSEEARAQLVPALRKLPGFYAALAYEDREPVGLINCFAGFSTFAARPLLNVHDIVVRADRRGRGVGRALLAWAEDLARRLGCCKLTLEVLSNNERAMGVYREAGYRPYQLDPAGGSALLLQKLL